MIIKLLEQPIIAMQEAEIAGTVDGVVVKGGKVSCIYHRDMEKNFIIPIENVIIGSDAVMIRDMTVMTLASQNIKSLKSMLDVYNTGGKHLGCLYGIEADDELVIRYIYTENYKIEMSRIMSYESVIVADIEEDGLEEISPEAECQETEPQKAEAEPVISMEIEPDIKWNDENRKPEEKNTEGSEINLVITKHQDDEKTDIPGVDAKYAYLCGKQLLEGIDIEDKLYDKGTIIDVELIKHAIASNAIVKVIVNAEE